jgi:alkylation response protein AidB-like acyl-CoA dehydrogenase
MKGSGSPDVALRNVFAPESRAFDLTGGKSCVEGPYCFGQFTLHAFHFAAMAAGIAQGALDDLTAIALSGKSRALARQRMVDSELFHDTLGRAEADLKAALALLESESLWCWHEAHSGPLRRAATVRVLQSVVWIIDASVRVVDACHTAAGGGSIYESAPLQRRLRDIHVLTQHALLRKQAYADSGAARLGHAPTIPFGRD